MAACTPARQFNKAARYAVPGLAHLSQLAVEAAVARLAGCGRRFLVVDATCGNGHDTLFLVGVLRRHCPESSGPLVLAFDPQRAAIASTAALLAGHGLTDTVRFFTQGHETLGEVLAAGTDAAGVFMYNLGFLPRSDRTLVTGKESTIASLVIAAERLLPGGLISVHAYGGHPGGREEMDAVEAWFSALPWKAWRAFCHSQCNKPRNPEKLFLAEKKEMKCLNAKPL